jgi:hypothetical protein
LKLLILAVDGLDPDFVSELGYPKMPHEKKLYVPPELYWNGQPSTLTVWASMLAGRVVYDRKKVETVKRRNTGRKINKGTRRLLTLLGAKKILGDKYKNASKLVFGDRTSYQRWSTKCINYGIETVADRYLSIMWNVPTICPEFLYRVPAAHHLRFRKRQYQIWKLVSESMSLYPYDLGVAYFHLIDDLAHYKREEEVKFIYEDVHLHARKLSERCDVIVVSDHGTSAKTAKHTTHSYMGSTKPINATTVLEVRNDIEAILDTRLKT